EAAGREPARDYVPVHPVVRRIHVEDHRRRPAVRYILVHVRLPGDDQAIAADERLWVLRDTEDVLVLADDPERLDVLALIPVDGRFTPQEVPRLPLVAVLLEQLMRDDVERVQ